MKVAIIESGGANFLSVVTALEKLGVDCEITHNSEKIKSADAVILPGVGSAGFAMQRLNDYGLYSVISALKQPVLGICLGMQLFYECSAEDNTKCLGIIPGQIQSFGQEDGIKVPHMGWNNLTLKTDTNEQNYKSNIAINHEPILSGIASSDDVYFVHSYYAPINEATVASCDYGFKFSAVVRTKNFYGMQFHPEKSGAVGVRLLTNFIETANANLSGN